MVIFSNFESSLSAFKIYCDKTKFNTLKFDWTHDPAAIGPMKQRQKEYIKTDKKPKEGFISTGNISKKITRGSTKLLENHLTGVRTEICAIMLE